MGKLTEILKGLKLGEPQTFANMRVYPLHVANGHKRGYQTLTEGLKTGEVQITEVSEGGSVPDLKVKNTGGLPVLVIVGEELIGSKQNRILNTSVIIPANTEVLIPVSCVEQGRWHYTSRAFDSSDSTAHFAMRKMASENVTKSLREREEYDAKQGQVWAEVERKISSHQTSSRTRALRDVYEQTEDELKQYLEAFKVPEAEGVVVEIDGVVMGAELFDHHETLRDLWGKLIKGYALDAVERKHNPRTSKTAPLTPQAFLDAAEKATEEPYESVGVGSDVRLTANEVTGSSLFWEDRLIHASLFNATV